jgi:ankyrin repeat protein
VSLLIENGANIRTLDDWAIRWASENGYSDVAEILLKNGADLHNLNDYAIRWASQNGHYEVVRLLLKNGARLDSLDWPMRSDIIKRLRF